MRRAVWAAAIVLSSIPPIAAEPVGSISSSGAEVRYFSRQYRVLADPSTGRLVRRYRTVPSKRGPGRQAAKQRGSERMVVQGSSLRALTEVGRDRVDLQTLIGEAARRHDVAPELILAVIRQESGFDPYAVSRKGAQGLMQLMPATAQRLGVKDVFDPAENIQGGVKYLRQLLDRYAGDERLALAAYNAGEGAVDRYGGVPPYAETRDYVQRIAGSRPVETVALGDAVEPEEDESEPLRAAVALTVADDGTMEFHAVPR